MAQKSVIEICRHFLSQTNVETGSSGGSALGSVELPYKILIGIDTLGKEELLIELAYRLKTVICVPMKRLVALQKLGMPAVFTADPTGSRIQVHFDFFLAFGISLALLHEIPIKYHCLLLDYYCL